MDLNVVERYLPSVLPESSLKFFAATTVSLFFCAIYRIAMISSQFFSVPIRKAFIIVVGNFLLCSLLGTSCLQVYVAALFPYILLRLSPPDQAHIYVLTFSFGWQIYRQWDYVILSDGATNKFHDSSYVMMLTVRVSYITLGLRDQLRKVKGEHLTVLQQANILSECPSFVDYLTYICFFPAILISPLISYVDVMSFVNQSQSEFLSKPSPNFYTVKKVGYVFLIAMFHIFLLKQYDNVNLMSAEFINSHAWFRRFFYAWMCGYKLKAEYYVAMTCGEITCLVSGIGYSGRDKKTGRPMFDVVTDFRPFTCETATSPKVAIDAWHASILRWYRYICYERAPYSPTLLTFFLSAMWHGCYIGYYIVFAHVGLIVFAARRMRKFLRPQVIAAGVYAKFFYDILTWACTSISINPLGPIFESLTWEFCRVYCTTTLYPLTLLLLFLTIVPISTGKTEKSV